MRCALVIICLWAASFPALSAVCTKEAKRTLAPRGTGSRSPSPSGGAPSPKSSSTGLLEDIVRQSQKRPASSSRPTGSFEQPLPKVAKPAAFASSASVQPIYQHQTTSSSHSLHSHPQIHPTHLGHSTHTNLPAHAAHAHSIDHPQSAPSPQLKGLRQIGAGLHPAEVVPGKRPARVGLPEKQKVKWWQKAGGKPANPRGTGPFYETQRRYREMKKLQKAQGKHMDEHPSGHHPHTPKGGGPGSPGAGSHAISRRR